MEQEINITEHFDFYDQTYLKTYIFVYYNYM